MDDDLATKDMSDRLRAIRFFKKMSQTEFAGRLKMAQNTYSHIETGKSPFTDKNIALICLTFGINEDWLRTGHGEMYVARPTSGAGEGAIGPSSISEPPILPEPIIHKRGDNGAGASSLPVTGPYQDRESAGNIDDIDAGEHPFEITPILAETAGGYPKDMSKSVHCYGGILNIDRTDKTILFTYSYDEYHEEIPFYILVSLYSKENKKTKRVWIDRLQVQDKNYDALVMFSDDIEYNTKDAFLVAVTRIR
jgi:transcriptional regulator with XRE-family HTH domain